MAPPVGAPSASGSSGLHKGPAKLSSRKFASDRSDRPSYADPDDYFSTPTKAQRSTAYTTPLTFVDEDEALKKSKSVSSAKLTKENLQNLQAAHEAKFVDQQGTDPRFDDPNFLAFMRKSKSRSPEKKKTDKKKNKDYNDHPLNLPPSELKRLSARMARDERKNSATMDGDVPDSGSGSDDAQADAGTNSQPATPGTNNTPGAFPSSENLSNGDLREDTKSPPPPPHRISSQPKMDPEAAKAAGNKFFKAKDYGRAVVEYSKAVEADPQNPTYLSNRAAAYMSDNKFQAALGDCLQASRMDPDNDKVLHRLARIYTSLGRPEDALSVYSRIPNASATDTGAARKAQHSIEMAEKQLDQPEGDGKMALWNIDQAKQTLGYGTPMPRRWQTLRARANLKIGSANALGEVQSIAQTLMRDNPMDAEAMTLAGRAFYLKDDKGAGKSDYQRAEDCFRKALSFDPDMSEARDCLRMMKKLERAKNEANDLYKRSQWEPAVNAYTECLAIDPTNKITNAKILGNRALARSKIEQYEEAKADCDAALKLDPTYTKARRTRAKVTGELGDWEQAVKDLKALAEDNQGDAEIAKELRNAELELKKSKRKDWYKILGVSKEASDKEIERAYKKKAAVLHPDKTQGDKEKEELFKDCLEAKETLLDPQKRQIYDSGADLMEPGMGGSPFGGGFGHPGMGGGVQIDPEMLFNMMGGMGGGRQGGFPGGFSFSSGGPGMGGGRGGFPFG
ncbi:hypothetical protein LTR64_004167 [Lithohypha guttulata]|uniref:uncharacterized protein n=1 Tax=Lithohypha guttulata TaxID=1690604 RepID=UPI00315E00F2